MHRDNLRLASSADETGDVKEPDAQHSLEGVAAGVADVCGPFRVIA
jgi:hypothetical protein